MELAITIQTSSVIFDIFALLLYEREAYGTVMYTLTRPELLYDNDMIYLLTAIGLSTGGSVTVHIETQTIHRTTQMTKNNTNNN